MEVIEPVAPSAIEPLIKSYTPEDDDLPYEEDLLHNPGNLKSWLRYIAYKSSSMPNVLFYLYERALLECPWSFKLWREYLDLQRIEASKDGIQRSAKSRLLCERTNSIYERALGSNYMSKYIRLWVDYLQFLLAQKLLTRTRRVFEAALRALPATQHQRLWETIGDRLIEECEKAGAEETAVRLFRRSVKLMPEERRDILIKMLKRFRRFDEAAVELSRLIEDGKLAEDLVENYWEQLCDLLISQPRSVESVPVEQLIRAAIAKFPTRRGQLWTTLATWHMLRGRFATARENFEEAIQSTTYLRDFAMIFDAYAKFEETLVAGLMASGADDNALEAQVERFEGLLNRREFLAVNVELGRTPNDVDAWMRLVKLYSDDLISMARTYEQAISTINPKKAVGSLPSLWDSYARLYEEEDRLEDAKAIYEKAVRVEYENVEEAAKVWLAYSEYSSRHGGIDSQLEILSRATSSKDGHPRLPKCLTLWNQIIDIEEMRGLIEPARAAYDRVIELKIAVPQIIVNYAFFLRESGLIEEAFKVYERGIASFGWPVAFELWNLYLPAFIDYYGQGEHRKIERIRDLFEQALTGCPTKFAKSLYLLYAKMEEEHGLVRSALRIYERACETVPIEERPELYKLYIERTRLLLGLPATRPIYQIALSKLLPLDAAALALPFARLETQLGEPGRARSVYAYVAQFCDPRIIPSLWETWQRFETENGDENTFREMLRIKRAVTAKFVSSAPFVKAKIDNNVATGLGSHLGVEMTTHGANEEEIRMDL